jgi:hypothetical protein
MGFIKFLDILLEDNTAGCTEVPCDTGKGNCEFTGKKFHTVPQGGFVPKCYCCPPGVNPPGYVNPNPAPVTKKYACVNGNCVESASGTYTTSNCNNACGGSTTYCPTTSLVDGTDETNFRKFLIEKYPNDIYTSSGTKFSQAVSAKNQNCNKVTKNLWNQKEPTTSKTYGELYLEYKNNNNNNNIVTDPYKEQKEKCAAEGGTWNDVNKTCVKPVVVDPDVQQLVDDMDEYRTVLNTFENPTGWISLDTLSPSEFTPDYLSLKLLTDVTDQIVELIENKNASSDFGNFVDMIDELKNAYNKDKFKEFFQSKVDPKGTDVFGSIDTLINRINTAADEIESSLNYDPLDKPNQTKIDNYTFIGQLMTVYKMGKINLMMMVYSFKGNEEIRDDEKSELTNLWNPTTKDPNFFDKKNEEYKGVYDDYVSVHTSRNFENCKNMLGTYLSTHNNKIYDVPLLSRVKYEIQKCWCDDQYEDLGKVGVKNMFNVEMRKGRKELIKFLNRLPSEGMGEFRIRLDDSICGKKKRYK